MAKLILAAAVAAAVSVIAQGHSDIEARVKNGEIRLQCQFDDGWRTVPADRVQDFDGARWYFDNGSASRCKVSNIQELEE